MRQLSHKFLIERICGFVALSVLGIGLAGAQADNAHNGLARDAWLDGKLESALLFNPHLNSFDIHTDVRSGVAHLSGFVESEIDAELAVAVAESINGITSVESSLAVDPNEVANAANSEDPVQSERRTLKETVNDLTLTARVKARLLANDSTSGLTIDVDTIDGVVTLTGIVGSRQEKALAGRLARNVDTDVEVENFLVVDNS